MFFRGYSQVTIDHDQVFTDEWAQMKTKHRTLQSIQENDLPVQMWHKYIVPRTLATKKAPKERGESGERIHANLKPNRKPDPRKKAKK
jgi:hypothetical protein